MPYHTAKYTPTDDGGTRVDLRVRLADRSAISKLVFAPVQIQLKRVRVRVGGSSAVMISLATSETIRRALRGSNS